MGIEKIIVENFQKHENLELDLGQITCIVGETDCGKSSIIRALSFVINNEPPKGEFITFGKQTCTVQLNFEDGTKLVRKKNKTENSYFLDDQEFKALRGAVPEEISKTVRIHRDSIQMQHDPLFWLSESPAEVSRRLNAISDLQIMDFSLSEINAKIKQEKSRCEYLQGDLNKLEDKRKRTQKKALLRGSVQEILDLEERIKKKQEKSKEIDNLLTSFFETSKTIRKQNEYLCSLLEMKECLSRLKKQEENRSELNRIIQELDKISQILKKPLSISEDLLKTTDEKIRVFRDKHTRKKNLNSLFSAYRAIQEEIAEDEKRLMEEKKHLERFMKGRCPLCGRN